MSTAGLINRYVWFVMTIYNRGPITLEEIQHRFESHFGRGEALSERQFHRYTDAVEELFDIEIKYSRSQRGYIVADHEGIDNMGMRKWLLQTFSVNGMLHESQELKNRILLEDVPSGQQYLTTIVDAMREGVALSMTYQSFGKSEPSTFEVEPYCVKLLGSLNLRSVGSNALIRSRAYKRSSSYPSLLPSIYHLCSKSFTQYGSTSKVEGSDFPKLW